MTKSEISVKMSDLKELYIEQLQDLYSAETQLIEALPKMAEAASSSELKRGFVSHLAQTRTQAQRLEQILGELNEKPGGKTCKAMQGLVAEGDEMIKEKAVAAVKDAGLIAAAQRVEHYEIAGYGTVKTYAKILGMVDQAALLQTTEDEEKTTDKTLSTLADTINLEAASD
ncbi:ferritin-like domain-containing protein [Deinococcus sp.]|uniref:ferritin-like domain-containing protein n=1 Tax=Deinococcus sp. TaxID=47478 RepID=UPI003CC6A18B